MRKQLLYTLFFISTIFLLTTCSKEVLENNLQYKMLTPINEDLNAGDWKPILISSPKDFACPTPISTSSPDYILQINEIKSIQKEISAEEMSNLKYWGAGSVLRWNEIMRELVAKYNLPPYQNPDGTYPVPNPNNPLSYPTFPFANPPYAARAYAYLSAAQYDAAITCFYYKKLYNRAAPNTMDNSIKVLLPQKKSPSFPSEEATIMAASVEILKLLFPGEQDYINKKAEEHKQARLLSGLNVRSDIEAGEIIGKAIAAKFIARARTDKAGAAVGTPNDWAAMKKNCEDIGEMPWKSLESPERPPMLPLFGKVQPFLFSQATLESTIRPGPPPSTHSNKFKEECDEVYYIKQNLTREQLRIANFWADGIRTYTPPGHWNYIAANDFVTMDLSEVRWARNMALLNMSLMDAAIVCWNTKYTYFNPRPSQFDPRIKTDIGLPNFPSYISGHSTFSGAAATILGYLNPQKAIEYENMAKEASISRMYGAIHFRSDCEVGLQTGNKVGSFAIERAKIDGAD